MLHVRATLMVSRPAFGWGGRQGGGGIISTRHTAGLQPCPVNMPPWSLPPEGPSAPNPWATAGAVAVCAWHRGSRNASSRACSTLSAARHERDTGPGQRSPAGGVCGLPGVLTGHGHLSAMRGTQLGDRALCKPAHQSSWGGVGVWGIQARAAGAQNRGVTVAGAHRSSPEECRGNKPTARKDGERGPLVVQVRASGMRDVVTGTCDTQVRQPGTGPEPAIPVPKPSRKGSPRDVTRISLRTESGLRYVFHFPQLYLLLAER